MEEEKKKDWRKEMAEAIREVFQRFKED